MNAGIKVFHPSQPFNTSVNAATPDVDSDVRFPTLAKINDEFFEWN